MMRTKKMLAVLGCAAMLLGGCTESNIVAPSGEAAQPDFTIKKDVKLVWEQVYEGLGENLLDSEEYPQLEQIGFHVDEENKMIDMEILVADGTDKETAVEYATAVVKAINDEVNIQSAYYEKSTDESYGGFFKEYGFNVTVAPSSAAEDESAYLVNDSVAAGEERAIAATED